MQVIETLIQDLSKDCLIAVGSECKLKTLQSLVSQRHDDNARRAAREDQNDIVLPSAYTQEKFHVG